MSEPRIAELRFKPKRLSPWAALRVGMTVEEARTTLGPSPSRELVERVRRGQIVFQPPIQAFGRDVGAGRAKPPQQRKPVKYVNREGTTLRSCLCCRQSFDSSGPGNRMCDGCRGRNVSPFEPG